MRPSAVAAALVLLLAACSGGPVATGPAPTRSATAAPDATDATGTETPDETAGIAGGGPPAGRYLCYLVPAYQYNGYVELLDGGGYEAGYTRGEPQTEGRYSYDAATQQVSWSGGTYAEDWPVAYYVAPGRYPDGSPRVGTGSDRETIALKVDQSSGLLPGQETGSNPIYSYCYLEQST
jgi:hypothetical protein